MIIQHNMLANNTNRQLKITTGDTADAVEKLSSGYRINRAADDAAGLAISEKMRGQIRGLDQGALNVQDGQNFCNVADGAMQEMENIIHRMRELAVQAANDTYTDEDRIDIQFEIEQLQLEVDRMSKETEFNTIKVFSEGAVDNLSPAQIHSIIYGQLGNNYGLTTIVGASNVWGGQYMNDQIAINTPNWDSTGTDHYWRLEETHTNNPNTNRTNIPITDHSQMVQEITNFLSGSGITLPSNPTQQSYTLTSSNGRTTATIYYSKRDYNGNPYLTNFSCTTVDNNGNTTDKLTIDCGSPAHTKGFASLSNIAVPPTFGSAWIDFRDLGNTYTASQLVGEGFTTTCGQGCGKYYSIKFTDQPCTQTVGGVNFTPISIPSASNPNQINPVVEININNITSGDQLVQAIMTSVKNFDPNPMNNEFTNHWNQLACDLNNPTKLYIYDNCSDNNIDMFEPSARDSNGNSQLINDLLNIRSGSLWIQSGANSNEGLFLDKPWVSLARLKLSRYSVLTTEKAEEAISLADTALGRLNEERARIGAMYNCLDHSYANDTNTSENLQSAESKIRDANMADEMVRFAKDSILMQAGQAMLAQANQTTQGIVQLLGK